MVQPNDEVDLIEREREDGQKVRSVRVDTFNNNFDFFLFVPQLIK